MELYAQIFKRKSFHIFRDTETISDAELDDLKDFILTVRPLDPDIRTEITVVPEAETTCRRGAQYCILFRSEPKDGYLRNIGYIGEQIDLYLASVNIGALWFGIGRPLKDDREDHVIMIAIAKMPENKFRKDMFRAKRKPAEEVWQGETYPFTDIVRFSPSACNTQPWFTVSEDGELKVYRYLKPGKRGIMPKDKVTYYNRIDIGIYMFMLETCLEHDGYAFERELFRDPGDPGCEMTLNAVYRTERKSECI